MRLHPLLIIPVLGHFGDRFFDLELYAKFGVSWRRIFGSVECPPSGGESDLCYLVLATCVACLLSVGFLLL